jgi:membrane protein
MNPKSLWRLVKDSASAWMEDKAPRLGAALAYYTIFSLAPLLVLVIAIVGLVFGREAAQGQLLGQIRGLVGEQGGKAVQEMVAHAAQPSAGGLATALGIIMLLFGAMGLFGQLQDALNTVWEVQPKPGRGVLGFLKDRFLSFSMVLGVAFLLLVSLVINAWLAALAGLFGDWQASVLGYLVNGAVSFVVITLLFAMIYRFLPDAEIAWKDVWLGAVITSILFLLGKFLIGLYLGHSSVGSVYGAAGSLAVLLVWLYYSSQIFLFGAEFTKVYANTSGSRIVPAPNAMPVTAEARAQEGAPREGDRRSAAPVPEKRADRVAPRSR